MLDQSTPPGAVQEAAGDTQNTVAGQELRQFVERIERLNAEIADLQRDVKEVYSELKGRGYLVTPIRKIVAMRKRDANDVAEEESVIEMYKSALGM